MSEAAPPLPEAPAPPRRRWIRWALGGAAALVATVAALPWLLGTSWVRTAIHGWLRDNVDREVAFRTLDVSWTRGVRLGGLTVAGESAGDPPLLEAPLVVLRMPLFAALVRDLRVDELEIVDPVVHVVRRTDGGVNTDVLRTKKVRRKRGADSDRPAPEAPAAGGDEATALPDIRVPVRVRNLTLVVTGADGRTARKKGVEFDGELTTRDGPTLFDLRVPDGPASGLTVKGSAHLFDAEGVVRAPADVIVRATVVATALDAAANRELLRLFVDRAPEAGVLDARIEAESLGASARGTADVRLRGIALAGATRGADPPGDDLTVKASWKAGEGRLALEGLRVRAEGLTLDADVAGPPDALAGRATLDADLARLSGALRAMGFDLPPEVAGRLAGTIDFAPSPAQIRGDLALTGGRIAGLLADRPAVELGRTDIAFVVAPAGPALRIERCEARLSDVTVGLTGSATTAGVLDLRGTMKGDLGALLGRVRDLGFLRDGFAVNGDLDAAFAVTGDVRGEGAAGPAVDVEHLTLTEDDVRIDVKGRASSSDLAFTAQGAGDLGKLLGRAAAAGAGPGLDAVRGRFAFDVAASGTPAAPDIELRAFRLDGDFTVEASGKARADGGITADARADGSLASAVELLRRLGLLESDVVLDGAVAASASVRGTRDLPEVPSFRVAVTGADVTLDAEGSVSPQRVVAASARGTLDLARVTSAVRRSGIAPSVPPLAGRLEFRATAAGPTDNVAVPEFRVTVRDGAFDADVTGSLAASGRVAATVSARGDVASAARLARDGGWITPALTPPGRFTFDATLGGTRNQVQVPSAELRVDGPLAVVARGSYDATSFVKANLSVRGELQPLLDGAAQWTGGTAQRVDGTIDATVSAAGPASRLVVTLPTAVVRSAGVSVEATGSRDADGAIAFQAKARAALAELLAIARSFGVAQDVRATGTLDASAQGGLSGDVAELAASAVVTQLVLDAPSPGGEPFREPRVAFGVSNARYHLSTGRLDPVSASLEAGGAKVEATVEAERADAPAGGAAAATVVALHGRFEAVDAFAERHPGLLAGVRFERAEGPFRFRGDVAGGRGNAAQWTGGAELTVTSLTAPSISVDKATATAALAGGVVVVDPIDATVNGGPVRGTARIGLLGDRPSHTLDLTGSDVRLDADLAPLVARASPLFAIGEEGSTGGVGALDLHLTAQGLDSETLKRTATGRGEIGLSGAYVESSQLIGAILSLVGGSGRLDFDPAKVPFEVRDGRVVTGELPMQTAGLLLRLGGTVGLDGKLDYGLRVKSAAAGSALEKYAKLLDPEGFLPLRIEGRLDRPKLRAPDVKDVLKGQLADVLEGLFGDDDAPDAADGPDSPAGGGTPKGGGRKKKRKAAPEAAPDGATPPPEPPKEEAPKESAPKEDAPPPPPPPKSGEPAPDEEPPPPPPPPRKRPR